MSARGWRFDPEAFFAISKGIRCPECGVVRLPERPRKCSGPPIDDQAPAATRMRVP